MVDQDTEVVTNLQKTADFVRAFIFGFEVEDALAFSFEIQVKNLQMLFSNKCYFPDVFVFLGCEDSEGRSLG
jgi:hypothetical protein